MPNTRIPSQALILLCTGSVIGLSVQAGLYSRVDNNLADWRGTQYGFYFDIAWLSISLLAFIIFYRPQASQKVLAELQEKERALQQVTTPADSPA